MMEADGLLSAKILLWDAKSRWYTSSYKESGARIVWTDNKLTANCRYAKLKFRPGCLNYHPPCRKEFGCGIHSKKEIGKLNIGDLWIIGDVLSWIVISNFGKIHVHERGIKSEYADIVGVIDYKYVVTSNYRPDKVPEVFTSYIPDGYSKLGLNESQYMIDDSWRRWGLL